jgi:hypothetical protein
MRQMLCPMSVRHIAHASEPVPLCEVAACGAHLEDVPLATPVGKDGAHSALSASPLLYHPSLLQQHTPAICMVQRRAASERSKRMQRDLQQLHPANAWLGSRLRVQEQPAWLTVSQQLGTVI